MAEVWIKSMEAFFVPETQLKIHAIYKWRILIIFVMQATEFPRKEVALRKNDSPFFAAKILESNRWVLSKGHASGGRHVRGAM